MVRSSEVIGQALSQRRAFRVGSRTFGQQVRISRFPNPTSRSRSMQQQAQYYPPQAPAYQPVPAIVMQPQAQPQMQPMAAPTNIVVQTNQTSGGGRQQQKVQREWTTGLFDCCSDLGSCFGVTFCHPIYICMLFADMGECIAFPLLYPTGPQMLLRLKLRSQENIRGSILNDCCAVTFCGCCATCQIRREWTHVTKQRAAAMNNNAAAM